MNGTDLVVHLVQGRELTSKSSMVSLENKEMYVLENFVPLSYLTTFSIASKKSHSDATFLHARTANMPASVATDRSSTLVVFRHNLAIRIEPDVPLNAHAVSIVSVSRNKKYARHLTSMHVYEGYVHNPHYLTLNFQHVNQDDPVVALQSQGYLACAK